MMKYSQQNKQKVKKSSQKTHEQNINKGPRETMSLVGDQRDDNIDIKDILIKMSVDMHNIQELLNKRMDMIELKIEKSKNKMTEIRLSIKLPKHLIRE